MRIALPLLLLLLASTGAYAQTPQVSISDYGIYTADTTSKQAAPNAPSGLIGVVNNIRHAETARTIPMQSGVRFGFRYTIVGVANGVSVQVQEIERFPAAGLHNPDTGKTSHGEEDTITVVAGTNHYDGWTLERPWELVPGDWTFEVWYQGRKLAEQKFTVVKQ